jgi:hypothetical protein
VLLFSCRYCSRSSSCEADWCFFLHRVRSRKGHAKPIVKHILLGVLKNEPKNILFPVRIEDEDPTAK